MSTDDRRTVRVNTIEGPDSDARQGTVSSADHPEHQWTYARSLAGDPDLPSPRHLLCAAIAADLEMSVRAAAERGRISLQALTVEVSTGPDPSDSSDSAALRLQCDVRMQPREPEQAGLDELVGEAESSTLLLGALRGGLDIVLSADTRPVDDHATHEPPS